MKRALMLAYAVLAIIDLINCTILGQEVSIWLRPIQMLVLSLWVSQLKVAPVRLLLIITPLLIASVLDYLFYKYGPAIEAKIILLIIVKNLFFLLVLYNDIGGLRFTRKLFRWAFIYIVVFILICTMIVGKTDALSYVLSIQAAFIFLFISLNKSDSEFFRQQYLGYGFMVFSLIFAKILSTDPRWFIEAIVRFTFVLGHLLFSAGLAHEKLFLRKSNTLDYQSVK